MSASIISHTRLALSRCSKSIHVPSRRFAAQAALRSPSDDPEPQTTSNSAVSDTVSSLPGPSEGTAAPTRSLRIRSRSLEAVPQSQTPRKSILQPTRVEMYLANLQTAGLDPTLADLERCRPSRRPSSNSAQYAEEYNRLVDSLCRSFSKEQLRRFLEMYKVDSIWSRPKRRKVEYAETILELQWGWPCLKEIERAKRDRTEVVFKSFPLNAHQLFLILGTDGSDLLQMSLDFNVHISLSPEPLTLNIEGLRGTMKHLEQHLSSIKKGIVDDVYQLPVGAPLQPHLIRRISRLAGAYIENVGQKGKVRIYAKDVRGLANAHRLVARASYKVHSLTQPALLTYTPPASNLLPVSMFPHSYALYPFLSPRTLPWTMNTAGAFRLRKVGEWLGNTLGEDMKGTGGLAGGRSSICTSDMVRVGLDEILFSDIVRPPADSRSTRVVKASLGHLLFTTTGSNQRASLVPPLKGYHQFSKIMKWVGSNDTRPSFVPSLPSSLMNSSPHEQKLLHRLNYLALPPLTTTTPPEHEEQSLVLTQPPTKMLSYEVELPHPDVNTNSSSVELTEEHEQEKETAQEKGETQEEQSVPEAEPHLQYAPQVREGQQRRIELMMPDRAMDLQLTLLDTTAVVEGEEPSEIREYTSQMQEYLGGSDTTTTQPDPPLTFVYKGDTYILDGSDSVRQSSESADGEASSSSIHVITESILDLESSQKATQCEILCSDPSSEQGWTAFLTQCDKLTSTSHRPQAEVTKIDDELLV